MWRESGEAIGLFLMQASGLLQQNARGRTLEDTQEDLRWSCQEEVRLGARAATYELASVASASLDRD